MTKAGPFSSAAAFSRVQNPCRDDLPDGGGSPGMQQCHYPSRRNSQFPGRTTRPPVEKRELPVASNTRISNGGNYLPAELGQDTIDEGGCAHGGRRWMDGSASHHGG